MHFCVYFPFELIESFLLIMQGNLLCPILTFKVDFHSFFLHREWGKCTGPVQMMSVGDVNKHDDTEKVKQRSSAAVISFTAKEELKYIKK